MNIDRGFLREEKQIHFICRFFKKRNCRVIFNEVIWVLFVTAHLGTCYFMCNKLIDTLKMNQFHVWHLMSFFMKYDRVRYYALETQVLSIFYGS